MEGKDLYGGGRERGCSKVEGGHKNGIPSHKSVLLRSAGTVPSEKKGSRGALEDKREPKVGRQRARGESKPEVSIG